MKRSKHVSPSNVPPLVVRGVTAADAGAVFALAQGMATSFAVERDAFDHALSQVLTDSAALLAVAEANGIVGGYVLGFEHAAFYANGKVGWVEEIAVAPAQRRKGIGASLMRHFEQWAQGRGAKLVGLATRRAAPFYHAIGYEESAIYFRKLL